MANEKKKLGTKWLSFLYVWFRVQIFFMVITFIANLRILMPYGLSSGLPYGSDIFGASILFMNVVHIAIKIAAVHTKDESSGYRWIIWALMFDVLAALVSGLQQENLIAGLIAAVIMLIVFFIPNMIYLKRRRFVFEYIAPKSKQDDSEAKAESKYRCGNCGQEGPFRNMCPSCGSKIKLYYNAPEKD